MTFCAVKSNVLLGWLIGLGRVEVRFVYTKKIYNAFWINLKYNKKKKGIVVNLRQFLF